MAEWHQPWTLKTRLRLQGLIRKAEDSLGFESSTYLIQALQFLDTTKVTELDLEW